MNTENKLFDPSPYVLAINDAILHGKSNLLISAVAGSGKTTSIVGALKLINTEVNPTMFCAFNKSIVKELSERVPKSVVVGTMHSIGWKAIIKYFKQFRPQLDDRKYDKLLKILAPTWDLVGLNGEPMNDEEFQDYCFRVLKLTHLGRANMVDLSNGVAELEELAEKHNIEIYNGECKNALNVIKVGNRDTTNYDFTDMIYIPAVKKIPMDKYKFVFVDECQDLNRAQQEILKLLIDPNGGRFVAVGDPAQAIYGFAGADVESFSRLKEIPNTIELPLSVCYRCGKEIIKYAQSIVPHLSYPETAKDGIVREGGKLIDIKEGDYVLCRNTAPLVMLCLQFLAQGKKATIMGGDIGKNLVNMVKKTKRQQISEMFLVLENDLQNLKNKLMGKKGLTPKEVEDERQIVIYKEKMTVLEMIVNEEKIKTADYLIKKIENIFRDEVKGIVFSTIHKSKGLEADRVHIICRELMPSKYAKKAWEKEQEKNLAYVAYTRAKSELIFNDEFKYKQGE